MIVVLCNLLLLVVEVIRYEVVLVLFVFFVRVFFNLVNVLVLLVVMVFILFKFVVGVCRICVVVILVNDVKERVNVGIIYLIFFMWNFSYIFII